MNRIIEDKLNKIGVRIPKILLPKYGTDLNKWAVVACDQYTSELEYWEKVKSYVGNQASTCKIIFPEVYLENPDKQERIKKINITMEEYLNNGFLEEKFEGLILTERITNGGNRVRHGLLLALDLEKYEYTKGSKTLIRATEGTVESRIPPRLEIRKNALVELPHIMVLINDFSKTVIEPLIGQGEKIYDFELMMGGGHLRGWKIVSEEIIEKIINGLEELISPDGFLFAMGDGNHSLATAKVHWQNIKNELSGEEKENHPARFALVELVNLHDNGLEFEPIHRVMFNVDKNDLENFLIGNGDQSQEFSVQMVSNRKVKLINLKESSSNLVVGNLQLLLDKYLQLHPEAKIDYVHGVEAIKKLAVGNNVGFLLPTMKKEELFVTVEKDGALPRKTFSMGEAEEKRFYLEARKIVP